MECLDCCKDYFDTTIMVHYDGEYNYKEMIEYVKRSYPNEVNYKVVENEKPSTFREFLNVGRVIISCV